METFITVVALCAMYGLGYLIGRLKGYDKGYDDCADEWSMDIVDRKYPQG